MTSSPTIQDLLTHQQNDDMVKSNIRYLPTSEAYDLWASVYDTDGNFLQAIDSIEMQSFLPRAVSLLEQDLNWQNNADETAPRNLKAVDLGCGTGRNTLNLLPIPLLTTIVGLEFSPRMLEIARQKCTAALSTLPAQVTGRKIVTFHEFDILKQRTPPHDTLGADLLISTLVLEHIPLQSFFACVARILRPGGLLILTNMHSHMGSISQAGFVDPKTGDKVRPMSYAHGVGDVLGSAKVAGLEVVSEGIAGTGGPAGVREVNVDEELAGKLGERGRKWIGVTVWFGGIWRKTD